MSTVQQIKRTLKKKQGLTNVQQRRQKSNPARLTARQIRQITQRVRLPIAAQTDDE